MIKFATRQPLLMSLSILIVFVMAYFSFQNMSFQLLPDMKEPKLSIQVTSSGKGIDTMSHQVTEVIENELAPKPDVVGVKSTTTKDFSSIEVSFDHGVDIKEKKIEVLAEIAQLELPSDTEIQVDYFSSTSIPLSQFVIKGNADDKAGLSRVAEQVKVEVEELPGISSVSSSSTNLETWNLVLNEDKLADNNLSAEQVFNAIQTYNSLLSLGELAGSTIQVNQSWGNAEALKNIPLSVNSDGKSISVGDVSELQIEKESGRMVVRLDEEEAVQFTVFAEENSNLTEVSDRLSNQLESISNADFFSDYSYVVLNDQGQLVQDSLGGLYKLLISGALIAMLVLFIFLRNLKTLLIISVSIPLSLALSFSMFYHSGFTLNLMTLGAFALAIGMLVDNSIVVLENIYRHIQKGKKTVSAAIDGTKEVLSAIWSSTITTMVIFVPLLFVEGMLRSVLYEFSFTVIYSLFASAVVSILVIPFLTVLLYKNDVKLKNYKEPAFFAAITKRALKHRLISILLTVALLAVSLFYLVMQPLELLPSFPSENIAISLGLNDAYDKEKLLAEGEALEAFFADKPEVAHVSFVYDNYQFDGLLLNVLLNEKADKEVNYTSEYQKYIQETYPKLHSNLTSGEEEHGIQTMEVTVHNPNPDNLVADVEKIKEAGLDYQDVVTADSSNNETDSVTTIAYYPEELVKKSMTKEEVNQSLALRKNGMPVGLFEIDNRPVMMNIRFEEGIQILEDLSSFDLVSRTNETFQLKDVAKISEVNQPIQVLRENQKEIVKVTFEHDSHMDPYVFEEGMQEQLSKVALDKETTLIFEGEKEEVDSSFQKLLLALVVSLVIIYVVLANQFNSFRQPLIVMLTIPFILIGIAAGFLFTDIKMSVTAFTGIIILGGIVVNNAILLIDYINQNKKRHTSPVEAILEAVKVRTRPILMTSLTTVLGLLPLIIGANGADLQKPMAVVIVGGLLSSTFLTLILIPVFYSLFTRTGRQLKSEK